METFQNLFDKSEEYGIFALESNNEWLYIGIFVEKSYEELVKKILHLLKDDNQELKESPIIQKFTLEEKQKCNCILLFSTKSCNIKQEDRYLTYNSLRWMHYNNVQLFQPKYNTNGLKKEYDFGFARIPKNEIEYQESQGEQTIAQWLKIHNIDYQREYSYEDLIGDYEPLRFDFKIKHEPIVIEFQGQQHYSIMTDKKYEDTEEKFLKRLRYDALKREYCARHHIRLIEIPYSYSSINQYLDVLLQ